MFHLLQAPQSVKMFSVPTREHRNQSDEFDLILTAQTKVSQKAVTLEGLAIGKAARRNNKGTFYFRVTFQGVAARLRSMRLDFNRTFAHAQGVGLSSEVKVWAFGHGPVSGPKLKGKEIFSKVVEDQTDYNDLPPFGQYMQRENATRLEVVFDENSCGELANEVLLHFSSYDNAEGDLAVEFTVRHLQSLTIHLFPECSTFYHCTCHWSDLPS
jgi:hypothetical protein